MTGTRSGPASGSDDLGSTVEPADRPEDLVRGRAKSFVAAANQATGAVVAYSTAARRSADVALEQGRSQAERERRDGLHQNTEDLSRIGTELQRITSELAPEALSASWDHSRLLQAQPAILDAASFVRCGSVRRGADSERLRPPEFPLLLPLLDRGNIVLSADHRNAAVDGTVQEVVLRALLGTGPGQLNVTAYDPKLRGTLAPFAPLRDIDDTLMPTPLASGEEFGTVLRQLSRDVRRISEMFGGVPMTLGDFRRKVEQPVERYTLVVIFSYPHDVDSRTHELLRTLMRSGPACGVSFVLHHDPAAHAQDGVRPLELYEQASVLRMEQGGAAVDHIPGYAASVGLAPSLAVIEPAVLRLKELAREAAAPKIRFSMLQPAPAAYWSESSSDRLTAVIGRSGHSPLEITLGDEREQKHNILVSGAVGQGKSNLLMVLVHSWAMRYSPDEMELYLLDLRDGMTLYPLAPNAQQEHWLPHARVLGLETDREYAAAVLRYLVEEFDRRAELMRPFGDNLARFREAQPQVRLPRIVLVIDEFHVLFEQDDEISRQALLDLERLARKGRGFGIHLVLASQTLSGITAILAKQDGIFAQFPIRLALKNSPSESRTVLDQNNTEASRLRYRGELVVNTDFGQVDSNRRAVVALADPAELAAIREGLWRRASHPTPPAVSRANAPAELVPALQKLRQNTRAPHALIGRAVSVAAEDVTVDMSPQSGRHLSIVGSGLASGGPKLAAGAVIVQVAVASLAAQLSPGEVEFAIFDLLSDDGAERTLMNDLVAFLKARKHSFEVHRAESAKQMLATLSVEVNDRQEGQRLRTPLFVCGFGMDRLPNLRAFDLTSGGQPIDGLHQAWLHGAMVGVHLLGWWGNVRAYTDHVGLEARGAVDALGLLRVTSEDVIDFFGPFVSWAAPRNRLLFRDVVTRTEPVALIPFAPLDASDARLLVEQLNG